MDTTEQNILMCEKAVEIQKQMCIPVGDPYEYEGKRILVSGGCFFTSYHGKVIWLPRQDQLQGILNIDDFTYLVSDFSEWVYQQKGFMYHLPGEQPAKEFTSMEQLWLAFVMQKLYSKQWSGKDWVKA